ncbi:NAD(P)/FAD-dependent oxidoreductase [Desnuesiella massiliensis]|uniref:NAD(P)/FAD-dependent oxidoreductase n=1 Tax=Desnuesiella massiliensis TaxID=1650662 RepID=UPI0006E2D49A|nr:NAD(P)/FAD-dependent oxidoreductase [Desnuesiella massiliensis]
MSKIIVIGAGPAGMMAAIKASEKHEVILIEGNEKIGKKLYITGKGRCNVTNAKDIGDFFDFIPGNPEFLYSALYTFTNQDAVSFFESLGVKLKVERGDRVFPESDKSSDIINAFNKALYKNNVKILLNKKVTNIILSNASINCVEVNHGEEIYGDYFIFCTGGFSYPQTGSNGECHELLKKIGHHITPISPSLVPVQIKEEWIKELQGLSLKNVTLKILRGTKVVYEEFGEMLFTHFGISGPIVLSASRYLDDINEIEDYKAVIDLKPALNSKELDERLQKDFAKYINKQFKNALDDLLPQKLISVIINLSNIDENKKVNVITRDERKCLVNLLKNLTLSIKSLRPIAEAIVTSGGIDVKEIDPSTMSSKIVNNLYFAGELMDVDAFTGGYNVQIAMSTGYLAGLKVGEK